MNKKNPVNRIGASLVITLALIALTYLLLPNGRSVGAAPKPPQIATSTTAMAASVRADQKRARMALGQLPLSFEMNRGQLNSKVQFASRGAGYKTFFTQSETVFVLRKPVASTSAAMKRSTGTNPQRSTQAKEERAERAAQRAASKAVVRMSLAGANSAPAVTGLNELPGKINYFRGNNEQKWITGVPTFSRVSYAGVYPGIDLVYYGRGGQLEYDLVVAPGADPSQIAFDFDGIERLEVDAASSGLVVHAGGGAQMRQGKPLIYQEVDGSKRAVSGGFIKGHFEYSKIPIKTRLAAGEEFIKYLASREEREIAAGVVGARLRLRDLVDSVRLVVEHHQPRGVQLHQRNQAVDLRLVGNELGEHAPEPQGILA